MSPRLFAVFDIGTTGTRSVIVDEEGREISKAYEEYPQKPKDVQVHEQLADTFWRTSVNTMQRAISGCRYGSDAINGVIVTNTRDSITPIDKDGNPLAPTVTWLDSRSTTKSKEMAEDIGPRKCVNKMMWFIENRSSFFKKVHKWVHLDAFINNRLCDSLVCSPADARFGPIDHETLKWSEELCESAGIPIDKLTDIVNSGTIIGEINSEAAKATSLRKGTPVIMGSGDQQCSALGMGVIKPGRIKATTGTGTFVITHLDEFYEEPYVMWCNPSAIPGKWILEGYGSLWIFTQNKNFHGGNQLNQHVLGTIKIHAIRSLPKGMWIAGNVGYGIGGRTVINEKERETRISALRLGVTYALPFKKHHALKFNFNSGIRFELGPDFNAFGILYQYKWGAFKN